MENFDDTSFIKSEEKLPKGVPFRTPEGYFESLGDSILTRIKINEIMASEMGNNIPPFETPYHYFENLSQHIENKVSQQDFELTLEDSFFKLQRETILSTITIQEKANASSPFSTPPNYFEQLSAKIEAHTSSTHKSRIQKLSFYKIAYAAAATIILTFGILYYSNQKPTNNQAMASFNTDSLSTVDIVNILNKSEISEDELISHIDTREIPIHLQLGEKELKNILDELDETELTKEL